MSSSVSAPRRTRIPSKRPCTAVAEPATPCERPQEACEGQRSALKRPCAESASLTEGPSPSQSSSGDDLQPVERSARSWSHVLQNAAGPLDLTETETHYDEKLMLLSDMIVANGLPEEGVSMPLIDMRSCQLGHLCGTFRFEVSPLAAATFHARRHRTRVWKLVVRFTLEPEPSAEGVLTMDEIDGLIMEALPQTNFLGVSDSESPSASAPVTEEG